MNIFLFFVLTNNTNVGNCLQFQVLEQEILALSHSTTRTVYDWCIRIYIYNLSL